MHTEITDDTLIRAIHQATIEGIKSLGVRHIRSLHRNEVSSYVRTGGKTYHAFEFDVCIEFNLDDIGIKNYHDSLVAAIAPLMAQRNLHNGAESFADIRNPAQVVAMREPTVHPLADPTRGLGNITRLGVFLRISFYDQCDHYLSSQSGERIYVNALIQEEDAKANAKKATNDFAFALNALHSGERVARHSWKEISYILLVPGSPKLTVDAGRPLARAGVPVGTEFTYAPHIDAFRKTSDVPVFGAWTPTQEDILATDWYMLQGDS